jgi:DNA-binding NarL/FixJ family response regulator
MRSCRVAVLDRHPAMRRGVAAILDAHPGLAAGGAAADPSELDAVLYGSRPDVVLVEHDTGARDGVATCLAITARPLAPRVVLWAADPRPALVVPAALARVDAIVDRAADARELVHAIRVVAGGGRVLPSITPRLQADAAARLAPGDRAIFAMRLAGTAPADIARTVGLRPGELAGRLKAIVAALAAGDAPDHPHSVPELAVPMTGDAA